MHDAQPSPQDPANPVRALTERNVPPPAPYVFQPEPERRDEEREGIDLRELWQVLVKRRWTIIVFLALVITAAVTATFLQTPIYRASLTLQIEKEVPKVVQFQNAVTVEPADPKDFYQTQYELLKSRTLAQRVIDQAGLAAEREQSRRFSLWQQLSAWATEPGEPAPDSELTDRVLEVMTVEPIRNSQLVRLHFEDSDPELAARVVNTWADAFINVNLERRFDASAYAKTFLEDQLQQIKIKLEDSERELVSFARQHEIVNIDERQSISHQHLEAISSALAEAEGVRIQAEVLHRQARSGQGQGLAQILDSPVIQKLKETKAALQSEYQDGLKVFKPAYPKMRRLASQVDEVQAEIDEEIGYVRAAISADYEVARAREAELKARLEEVKGEVIALQNRSIQYNILKREVDTNRQLYEGLLQQFKEVGVAGGVGLNNISIVDRARVPAEPFKPSLKRTALLALLLGLIGSVGLALLFEHLDDTVKLPHELERQLGLPVMGIIPREKHRRPRGHSGEALALIAQEQPRAALAEAYRSVRTALQFSTPEGAPRVLLVTSAAAGEGKSTTALSLAIQFAQAGRKVLLIDSDLRNPSLHHSLGIVNERGLTSYLTGDAASAEVAKPTFVPNLFLIPSGHLPPNPAELLSGPRMASLLELAAEKFDQVILDCSPVLGLADALVLGHLAEGTLLVVEAGGTRRGHAQGALRRLRTAHTRVLGGILTKLDHRDSGYGYHASDYYYYSNAQDSGKRLPA